MSAPSVAQSKSYKPITGKLNKSGYTVLAIAAEGKTSAVRARRGEFKIRPQAASVTLHLRASDGTYGGPIVVRRDGSRAILGVKAGAKLGSIRVFVSNGVAIPRRLLRSRSIVPSRWSRAKRGLPIGAARKVGLVRSRWTRSGAAINDGDRDGVPESLDVDDDGDRILDGYDQSTPGQKVGGARAAATFMNGSRLSAGTRLLEGSAGAVNSNAGSTEKLIAEAQQQEGRLELSWIGFDSGSAELDCGTLIYCSTGGTGRIANGGPPSTRDNSAPFPACCDLDGDGLGTLTWATGEGASTPPVGQGPGKMTLFHGATTDQIRADDVLIARGTVDGVQSQSATTVGFVFAAHPALASYSDGQGNNGTYTYPPPSGSVPRPVKAGPTGDVILTLTFWRPQRARMAGDPGSGNLMDIGRLPYTVALMPFGVVPSGGMCPQSSYSTLDPNLTPVASSPVPMREPNAGGFDDRAGDRVPDLANTLTLTVNVTQCLASKGAPLTPVNTVALLALSAWYIDADRGGMGSAGTGGQFIVQP